MDPAGFLADLEAKPDRLRELADTLSRADPWAGLPSRVRRVVFVGMGSSRYAADVVALRLRAAGIDAVAEYASARHAYPPAPDTLVVAVSAGGTSEETLHAVEAYHGRAPIVALTNVDNSALAEAADLVVPMSAGPEVGGVACRTYQHTLVLLLALAERLCERVAVGRNGDVVSLARRAADATEHLLDDRGRWLGRACDLLDGDRGVYVLAPVERLSSARQAALMVREGPRRPADAAETGDWSHVDVYLTKTLDYRALMFTGSRYDAQALAWLRERGSTVLAVGGPAHGSSFDVRYPFDDDEDVALLTETTVAELIAATWWDRSHHAH